MKPIMLQREDEVKTIKHPTFGEVRYVVEGEPYVFFPDVYRACGYQANSNTSDVSLDRQTKLVREYEKSAVKRVVNLLTEAGVEEFMMKGTKNKERRRAACRWILEELYGHEPPVQALNFGLTEKQIDIVVERVLHRLVSTLNGRRAS